MIPRSGPPVESLLTLVLTPHRLSFVQGGPRLSAPTDVKKDVKSGPRAASHPDSDRSCMERGGAQFLLPRSRQQSPRDRERGLLATVRFQGCHPDRCQRLGEALYCASLQRGLPTEMIGLPAILWITPAADQIAGCQNPVRSPKANHQDTEGLVPCGAVRIRTKTIKPQPIRA